jgi:hypothetical protein
VVRLALLVVARDRVANRAGPGGIAAGMWHVPCFLADGTVRDGARQDRLHRRNVLLTGTAARHGAGGCIGMTLGIVLRNVSWPLGGWMAERMREPVAEQAAVSLAKTDGGRVRWLLALRVREREGSRADRNCCPTSDGLKTRIRHNRFTCFAAARSLSTEVRAGLVRPGPSHAGRSPRMKALTLCHAAAARHLPRLDPRKGCRGLVHL